jgi:hypothetical protein
MKRTSNLVAYLAWAIALVAILMPSAAASAGLDLIADTQSAVFELVDEEPGQIA